MVSGLRDVHLIIFVFEQPHAAHPPTTPKLANGTETTDAPPRGVPSTHSHQPKSTPARSGSKPEIAASPPRSPAETSRCAPLAVGSPAGTPCAHLRGKRWYTRGKSRTGRRRGGALRAWRGAPGDVRSLPENPPRGSEIRKWVACSPPRHLRRSLTRSSDRVDRELVPRLAEGGWRRRLQHTRRARGRSAIPAGLARSGHARRPRRLAPRIPKHAARHTPRGAPHAAT